MCLMRALNQITEPLFAPKLFIYFVIWYRVRRALKIVSNNFGDVASPWADLPDAHHPDRIKPEVCQVSEFIFSNLLEIGVMEAGVNFVYSHDLTLCFPGFARPLNFFSLWF